MSGGRAPEYLSTDESVLALVRHFFTKKKPVASICHGQLILAAADVIKGRHVTAYPACRPVVQSAGATWQPPEPITSCFIDDNLVTGAAWPAHPEFLGLFLLAMGATVSNTEKKVVVLLGDFVEGEWPTLVCLA
jgi:D-lactate dehydratase